MANEQTMNRVGKWVNLLGFWGLHLAALTAVFTGVSWKGLLLCAFLYAIRMFGVTAGYHRYFSHRTYKMGRVMQFLMAVLAQSSGQKGVLWWSANHRHHHKYSDQEEDIHSPVRKGFWYSHVGWILSGKHERTRVELVKDLAKYPELLWLDKNAIAFTWLLGLACWLVGGWEGFVVGFVWSTVLLWHGTFTINSLSHVFGSRRFETTDTSKNNWLLALITLGEGWHNNHHYFAASARQGFRWWEVDFTYYALVALSRVGLVWDLRQPPKHLVDGTVHPRVAALERKRVKDWVEAVRPPGFELDPDGGAPVAEADAKAAA